MLSSADMHLGLSASLRLTPMADPGHSSAFGLRELLRRHGLAHGLFTRLDSLDQWNCRLFGKQVPHVRGNRGRLVRNLSVCTVVSVLDLRKMFRHAELGRWVAAFGADDDGTERVLSFAGGLHGWRVGHG